MTTSDTSAAAFAAKWRESARREQASSQEHFIDLCRLLGAPTPNEADPSGESYTFEAGAERLSTGRQGRADVWKRGHFGCEYKGAHADLDAAYRQLHDYREALGNPPALVVSDMDRIVVRTNFTGTRPAVHEITLAHLAAGDDRTAEALRVLRAVMLDPEELRPGQTPEEITQLAAARFAEIARSMHERGHDPAHHVNRIVFCLFAEDVRLLPAGIHRCRVPPRRARWSRRAPVPGRRSARRARACARGGGRGPRLCRSLAESSRPSRRASPRPSYPATTALPAGRSTTFTSAEKRPVDARVTGYAEVAPDRVVEVPSPNDSC